jgi:hypothetical protein
LSPKGLASTSSGVKATERRPGWATEAASFVERSFELTVIVWWRTLIAIHADGGLVDKIQRWLDGKQRPSYRRIPPFPLRREAERSQPRICGQCDTVHRSRPDPAHGPAGVVGPLRSSPWVGHACRVCRRCRRVASIPSNLPATPLGGGGGERPGRGPDQDGGDVEGVYHKRTTVTRTSGRPVGLISAPIPVTAVAGLPSTRRMVPAP